MQRAILGAVCALVIAVYAGTAHEGFLLSSSPKAADNYYNLLVQGFRAGQLNLKIDVPSGLTQLADPYNPSAHSPYPVLDMSYYRGKLYLYYGVTPALVLFWPYVALTGEYLSQKDAAVLFCLVGFLASAGLLCSLWRRYFTEVNIGIVTAGMLAVGLATFTPFLLARCDVYEASMSCGYALTMLALAAIWKALHEPRWRAWWLAAASLAYGLAVGARPSLLFGAVILLVPVVQAWREHRGVWLQLIAATGPIVFIGLGLMLYNWLRFDSPFEFGIRYALSGDRETQQFFSLRYLWFHFKVYFLAPARWDGRWPFVHDITWPPLPAGHGRMEHPFGVLTNIPLVWLAPAIPLAWRNRSAESRCILCRFLTALVVFFVICTVTISLFFSASARYEVEFVPTLVLLAVIGILSLERTSVCRPVQRRAARWGWGLLLGFSVTFNLLASVERYAETDIYLGKALQRAGQMQEAMEQYERALRIQPNYAEAYNNLGIASMAQGKVEEAIKHYEQALQVQPNYAEAHNNLGAALNGLGKTQEAIDHFEQALRIKPDYADAHCNLGGALMRHGRMQEAVVHFEQAVQLNPDLAEAHNNLGIASMAQGRVPEAIKRYEQALRIQPNYAEAHFNLGVAFQRTGQMQEAIEQYEQALRIKPDFVQAQNYLARARAMK